MVRRDASPRQRRRRPRLRRALLGLLLGFAGLALLVTQSGVLRVVVLPNIERLLGCRAEGGGVRLTLGGDLVISDLRLHVLNRTGPDAEFLAARTAHVDVAWGAFASGGSPVRSVRLVRPHVRVVIEADGELNLASLRVGADGSGPPGRLPSIDVVDGLIEVVEASDAARRTLATLNVMGDLTPIGPGRASLALRQPVGPSSPGTVSLDARLGLTGVIDVAQRRIFVELGRVDLREWSRQAPPRALEPFWDALDMSGQISQATLEYTEGLGLEASFELEDVSLTAPAPMREDAAGLVGLSPDQIDAMAIDGQVMGRLPMEHVTGRVEVGPLGVHADLDGVVGGVDIVVELEAPTFGGAGPLGCKISLEEHPFSSDIALWGFVPSGVDELFERLSSPTATLTGHVQLTRRPDPGAPGRLLTEASGAFELRQGRIKFDAFPYEVSDISGAVTFDGPKIDIYQLTGYGPSGAQVSGSARIVTNPVRSAVDVRVNGAGAQVDEHLIRAVRHFNSAAWDAAFDLEAHERLRADPGFAEALERLGHSLPGLPGDDSTVDLSVRASRPPIPDRPWAYTVHVRSPEVGLLPSAFPYPVVAENLRVRITPADTRIWPTRLRTSAAASATVRGLVEYDRGGGVLSPHLGMEAQDVSPDPLLLRALADGSPEDGPRALAARVIRAMRLDGAARDAELAIMPSSFAEPDGSIAANLYLDPGGLRASPGGGRAPVTVDDGLILVNDERGWFSLRGTIGTGTYRVDDVVLPMASADGLGDPTTPARPTHGVVTLERFDLGLAIEDLLGALELDDAASKLAALRRDHGPSGVLHGRVVFGEGDAGEPLVEASALDRVAFDAFGTRVEVSSDEGRVLLADDALRFEGLAGTIGSAGEPSWPLTMLDGVYGVGEGAPPTDIWLRMAGARLESALVVAAFARAAPGAGRWIEAHDATGLFDASLSLRGDADELTVSGQVRPRSFGASMGGERLVLGAIGGAVEIDGPVLRLMDVEGAGDDLAVRASGEIRPAEPSFDIDVSLEGRGFPGPLGPILPAEVLGLLEDLQLTAPGTYRAVGARLLQRRPTGAGPWRRLSGDIEFTDVGLRLAAPITGMSGTLNVSMTQATPDAPPSFAGRLDADGFTVYGLGIGRCQADVRAPAPNVLVIPNLRAEGYGGAATGRVTVHAPARVGGAAPASTFEAELRLSRIDIGAALVDAARDAEDDRAAREPAPFRGWLDGSMSAGGRLGDPASRRGRGELRIEGGDILQMPGAVNSLRVASLQPPNSEPLDFATAQVHLAGDRLIIDEATVESSSRTFGIRGAGYIDLPTLSLEVAFSPDAGEIKLLSEVFGGLRDEIFAPVLTGTLSEPRIEVRQLGKLRGMLGTIFQNRPSREADASSPRSGS